MIPLFAGAKLWVALGIAVTLFALGTGTGYKLADSRYRNLLQEVTEAELATKTAMMEQLQKESARSADLESAYLVVSAQLKTRVQTITREVVREVEKPVYNECVLPESGRVLLDTAVREANTAAGLDGEVQGYRDSEGGDDGRLVAVLDPFN